MSIERLKKIEQELRDCKEDINRVEKARYIPSLRDQAIAREAEEKYEKLLEEKKDIIARGE